MTSPETVISVSCASRALFWMACVLLEDSDSSMRSASIASDLMALASSSARANQRLADVAAGVLQASGDGGNAAVEQVLELADTLFDFAQQAVGALLEVGMHVLEAGGDGIGQVLAAAVDQLRHFGDALVEHRRRLRHCLRSALW